MNAEGQYLLFQVQIYIYFQPYPHDRDGRCTIFHPDHVNKAEKNSFIKMKKGPIGEGQIYIFLVFTIY